MIFYTAFFILTYLFSRLRVKIGNSSVQHGRAVVIGALMLLLMGFRDQTVAGDTITYVWNFLSRPIFWPGFVEFFRNTKEPLFYFVEYLCQQVTSSYTVYLFVTSFMVAVGFSKLLEDYSEDMFLSVLLFCGIGTMFFCMAGLRQAIAIGCTMLAFRYAKERKLIPFLAWCLVAYNFHNSSIVFVFVYWIVTWRPNWKAWIPVGIAVFLGLTRNPIVMVIANRFTSKEYEMAQEGLNYSLFFIQLVFVVFCFVYRVQTLHQEKRLDFDSLLAMSFIGLCFQALVPIKGEFFRVSSYFSVYLCMAVTKSAASFDRRSKALVNSVMIIGLLLYIYIFGSVGTYKTCF